MNLFSVCQCGDFVEMESKWIKIVSLDLLPSFILLIPTPMRALSLQPASPSTCLYKPSPFCHSPTNPNNSPFLLLLSLRLTGSRGYLHSGHAQSFAYWYWFFFPPSYFGEFVWVAGMNRGSRWRAKDRILPGDGGRGLASVSIHRCRLEWRSPASHCPSLAAIQPHRSDSGPGHPKGGRRLETHCVFCGRRFTSSEWQPAALIKTHPHLLRIVRGRHAVLDV